MNNHVRVFSTGGGVGEKLLPQTQYFPPQNIIINNYTFFCLILILTFWVQISSEEHFEGLDFKMFLGEHACSQMHGPIPLTGLWLPHNIAD